MFCPTSLINYHGRSLSKSFFILFIKLVFVGIWQQKHFYLWSILKLSHLHFIFLSMTTRAKLMAAIDPPFVILGVRPIPSQKLSEGAVAKVQVWLQLEHGDVVFQLCDKESCSSVAVGRSDANSSLASTIFTNCTKTPDFCLRINEVRVSTIWAKSRHLSSGVANTQRFRRTSCAEAKKRFRWLLPVHGSDLILNLFRSVRLVAIQPIQSTASWCLLLSGAQTLWLFG